MRVYSKNDFIPNGVLIAERRHRGACIPTHGHDFFEIEFILGGSGEYEIDGTVYPIEPDTVFLLSPAEVHSVRSSDMDYYNMMFQWDYEAAPLPFYSVSGSLSPCIRLCREDSAFLSALFSELTRVQDSNREYSLELLRCLLKKLYLCTERSEQIGSTHIRKAILYVLEHFRTGLTLDDTAAHVGLSKAYLCDLFRKETGIHFKEYLDSMRFSYACKMLLYTDRTVSEICDESGFGDYANFSRRFRAAYKITPVEYRRASANRQIPAGTDVFSQKTCN